MSRDESGPLGKLRFTDLRTPSLHLPPDAAGAPLLAANRSKLFAATIGLVLVAGAGYWLQSALRAPPATRPAPVPVATAVPSPARHRSPGPAAPAGAAVGARAGGTVVRVPAGAVAAATRLARGVTQAHGQPVARAAGAARSASQGVAAAAPVKPAPVPWRVLTIRRGDTLTALFRRAGLASGDMYAVLDAGRATRTLAHLRPGERIEVRTGAGGRLLGLRYALGPLRTLTVTRNAGGDFTARVRQVTPKIRYALVSGTVRSSLAQAMRRAGASGALVSELVNAFHWKVNFRRDVHPGARFTVAYQTMYHDGKRVGTGPLVAAELRLAHRTLRAFRYVTGRGRVYFVNARGASLEPSLLRTPLHYERVSSPFSLHRFDPVLHVWRPHYGVDLAAPAGTPVDAAGDGTVLFKGRDGGYGNLVEIRHFGGYSTRYAHLRAFAKGLHVGSYVHQGQVIGYVGETGEATGPHLHFEIRYRGVPHNPLTMALPEARPLPRREMAHFKHAVGPWLAVLGDPGRGIAGLPSLGLLDGRQLASNARGADASRLAELTHNR